MHDALASSDSFLRVNYTYDVSPPAVHAAGAWYESESNYLYRTAWVDTKDLRPVILESATLHFANVFTAEQLRASKFHVFFHSNLLDFIVDSAGGFNHCIWEGSAANVSVVESCGWPPSKVEGTSPEGAFPRYDLTVPRTTRVELTFPEEVILSGLPARGGTATVAFQNAFLADSAEEPVSLPQETVWPVLRIERISSRQIRLMWPQGLDGWQLQRHRSESPGNHIDLSYPEGWESMHVISPAPTDSQLILDNSGASEFFRLGRP
jgi:hypothetical protein